MAARRIEVGQVTQLLSEPGRDGRGSRTAAAGWRESAGNRRSIACSVNRFVNRTRRYSSKQGRRSLRSEMGSVLSAEVTEARETARDVGDAGRMAHNPEVEGSNPSPATKARGPFSNRERAFCMWFVHGFAHRRLLKPRADSSRSPSRRLRRGPAPRPLVSAPGLCLGTRPAHAGPAHVSGTSDRPSHPPTPSGRSWRIAQLLPAANETTHARTVTGASSRARRHHRRTRRLDRLQGPQPVGAQSPGACPRNVANSHTTSALSGDRG